LERYSHLFLGPSTFIYKQIQLHWPKHVNYFCPTFFKGRTALFKVTRALFLAINFLAATIYFLSHKENGKYSSLPHLLAFLSRSYDVIFNHLFSMLEVQSSNVKGAGAFYQLI